MLHRNRTFPGLRRASILLLAACAAAAAPSCSPGSDQISSQQVDPIVQEGENLLVITASDAILWNGVEIEIDQLAGLLQRTLTLPKEPTLRFEPEARADYELSAQVLRIMKESGVTKFGFVGNEMYRTSGSRTD